MGAAIAARGIYSGLDPYAATLLAVCGGAVAGLVTGVMHTRLKIPALLSGILTMIGLYSINLRIMGKANLSLLRMDTVYTLFNTSVLGELDLLSNSPISRTVPIIALAALSVTGVIIVLYWFFGTEIGFALRATGDNPPQMSRAQGIDTNKMIVLGLMISNGLVALSGALIAQQQAYADVQMGTGSIVIGLASVIIDEVLFGKNTFLQRLIALVLGAITYRIIIALVLEMGMPAQDLKLFTAITVAAALALPVFKSYLRPLQKKEAGWFRNAVHQGNRENV